MTDNNREESFTHADIDFDPNELKRRKVEKEKKKQEQLDNEKSQQDLENFAESEKKEKPKSSSIPVIVEPKNHNSGFGLQLKPGTVYESNAIPQQTINKTSAIISDGGIDQSQTPSHSHASSLGKTITIGHQPDHDASVSSNNNKTESQEQQANELSKTPQELDSSKKCENTDHIPSPHNKESASDLHKEGNDVKTGQKPPTKIMSEDEHDKSADSLHEENTSPSKKPIPQIKLDLYNFTDKDYYSSLEIPYVLTSPRSLKACANRNVRPVDLLPQTLSEYLETHPEQASRLTYDGVKRIWRRNEENKRIIINQCRIERARLIKTNSAKESLNVYKPTPSRTLSASMDPGMRLDPSFNNEPMFSHSAASFYSRNTITPTPSMARSMVTDAKLTEMMIKKRENERHERDEIFRRNAEYSRQLEVERQSRFQQQQELSRLIKKSQDRWRLHQNARRNIQNMGGGSGVSPERAVSPMRGTSPFKGNGLFDGARFEGARFPRSMSPARQTFMTEVPFKSGEPEFVFQDSEEKRWQRMQKAEIKRQMKKKEEVKKKIKENRNVQERVLARRAMMAAENDLILEETKTHNESRLVLASENIQAMYRVMERF